MNTGRMAPPVPGGTSIPVPSSDHGHSTERWPLRDAITLGALDGAVPSARAHVRQLLWEWDFRRKLHLMRIGDCVRAWPFTRGQDAG